MASLSSLLPGVVAAASVAEDGVDLLLEWSAATGAASLCPELLLFVPSADGVPVAAAALDGVCHSAVADEAEAPLSGMTPAARR